jgi:TonB family protein
MKRKLVGPWAIWNFKNVPTGGMRALILALIALTAGTLVHAPDLRAQQQTSRKAKKKVQPEFPPLARQAGLSGTVRVTVVITPAGKVKSAHAVGGSPMFIPAAEAAAKQWEFEPANEETSEVLEFQFSSTS